MEQLTITLPFGTCMLFCDVIKTLTFSERVAGLKSILYMKFLNIQGVIINVYYVQ